MLEGLIDEYQPIQKGIVDFADVPVKTASSGCICLGRDGVPELQAVA